MREIEESFTNLGATKATVKNTVTRVELRKGSKTLEITISITGVMCKVKGTDLCAQLPMKYMNAVIQAINFHLDKEK